MPIYEYLCQSCGAELEVLHGLNEPGPAACDVCGGPMRKRLAPPAIVFRGSGWAKKERREAAKTSASTSKDSSSSDDSSKAAGDGAKPAGDGGGPAAGEGAGETKPRGSSSSKAKDATSG